MSKYRVKVEVSELAVSGKIDGRSEMTGGACDTPVATHFRRLYRRHSSVSKPKSNATCIDCGVPILNTKGTGLCRACGRVRFGRTRRLGASGFWERVSGTNTPESCWEWTGPVSADGYGIVERETDDGHFNRAHRFAYYLTHGVIPPGMCVCHRCDNPRCVNPAHLFLGSARENNADRARKGRTGVNRGEAHHNAKFADAEVPRIWARLLAGESQASIAREYGVTKTLICDLAHERGRFSGSKPNA